MNTISFFSYYTYNCSVNQVHGLKLEQKVVDRAGKLTILLICDLVN